MNNRPYLPSPQARFEFGVRPGRAATPLQPDDDIIEHRRKVLSADREECFAMTAVNAQAFDEAAKTIARWTGRKNSNKDFETVAASVAEDIVVLVPNNDQFVIAGGMVAMPSGWSIREKVGRSVADTHQSVPGFAEQLRAKTDRMLLALKPGKFVERHNLILNPSDDWTIFPDRWDELDHVRHAIKPAEIATTIHLRTEYQTFTRCDQGETCLFAIRTHQSPIDQLTCDERNQLKEVIQGWSPAILKYKRITPMLESLNQFLA